MKELHRQGVRVRSRRIGSGAGFEIVPIGERRKRASSDPFAARRARADPFARRNPRTVPVRRHEPEYRARPVSAYGNPQYYRRAVPDRRGQYPVSPSYHGPKTSISGKIIDWQERRRIEKEKLRLKKIEEKKTEAEINEKMKQERVAQERAETARQVEKNRLHEEAVRFEREQQAARLKSSAPIKQEWHGGQVANVPQRPEPKVSQADVQEARTKMIEEGE